MGSRWVKSGWVVAAFCAGAVAAAPGVSSAQGTPSAKGAATTAGGTSPALTDGCVVCAGVVAAVPGRASPQGTPSAKGTSRAKGAARTAGGTSPAFTQACVDLLNGKVPAGGAKAITSLRSACKGLMEARTTEREAAEEQAAAQREEARAQAAAPGTGAGPTQLDVKFQPGKATAAPPQGVGVMAAFGEAGRELTSGKRAAAMGMKRGGRRVGFSLVTNPVGWFTGLGVNAEGWGSLSPKLSWVGGLHYSRSDATNGHVSAFGVEGGADWFVLGRYNEGLRLGPRLEVAFGRESFHSTDFGWVGLSGEVGYNFIAMNGLTGLVAGGLGARIAGKKQEDFSSFTGGEFGPYLKVGLGYSW